LLRLRLRRSLLLVLRLRLLRLSPLLLGRLLLWPVLLRLLVLLLLLVGLPLCQLLCYAACLDLHRERRHREPPGRADGQPILALPLLRLWREAQGAGGTLLHNLKRPQRLGHLW